MTTPNLAYPAPQQRTPSIAFPLILISFGLLFLLGNMGGFRGVRWDDVLRLWPLLLVIGGVDILLRPRSFAVAAVVEIAIIAGAFIYLLSGASLVPATALTYNTDVPRAGITDLGLTVNYGAGSITMSGGATSLVTVRSSQEDVSRTVNQNGSSATVVLSSGQDTVFGWSGGDRRWDIQLPSDVRTALTLNAGAGSFDLDLTGVKITRASINAGASNTTVKLPTPKGDVPIKITGGASSMDITVPAGVAYHVTYTGVMQSVSGPLSSPDYATATDRLTITLSAAMSSVTIH
jgi:cell wall-active antibiotic response 4TMS protein YvqF/uncharacterized protein DUF2154